MFWLHSFLNWISPCLRFLLSELLFRANGDGMVGRVRYRNVTEARLLGRVWIGLSLG